MSAIQKRKLGQSGLEVVPLCFGGNVFGWTADEPTSFQLLDAFVASGGNFIDTADVYSAWVPGNRGGESETILGNWFQKSGKRKDVILGSKVGYARKEKALDKAYILESFDNSLRRLKTDYIDLYQAHKDDPQTPMEESIEAFGQLLKAGKVRAIGASNYEGDRLAQALNVSASHGLPAYVSLQPRYNLYDREEFEKTLAPVCQEHHLGVIPYYSLANGFLTGKYRTPRDLEGKARGARAAKYMNDRGFRILEALDEVQAMEKTTLPRISLAWLMARPTVTAPIVSATSVSQWEELVGALSVHLKPESTALLDAASRY